MKSSALTHRTRESANLPDDQHSAGAEPFATVGESAAARSQRASWSRPRSPNGGEETKGQARQHADSDRKREHAPIQVEIERQRGIWRAQQRHERAAHRPGHPGAGCSTSHGQEQALDHQFAGTAVRATRQWRGGWPSRARAQRLAPMRRFARLPQAIRRTSTASASRNHKGCSYWLRTSETPVAPETRPAQMFGRWPHPSRSSGARRSIGRLPARDWPERLWLAPATHPEANRPMTPSHHPSGRSNCLSAPRTIGSAQIGAATSKAWPISTPRNAAGSRRRPRTELRRGEGRGRPQTGRRRIPVARTLH